MDARSLVIRDDLATARENSWDRLASPGTWWTGPERIAAAREEHQQKLTGQSYQSLMRAGQKPPLDYRDSPR